MRALVHRHLWQRLPQPFRRSLLKSVTSMAAPRPARVAPALGQERPVLVAGSLVTDSGLGESARLCLDSLAACGFDTYGVDVGPALMQKPGNDLPDFRDGRGLSGPGTLILHVNAPLVPLALGHIGRRLTRGKRIVGYWHWELPRVPDDWRTGLRFVHEIWAPSRFTAEAIAALTTRPIRVVPHPVPPPPAGEVPLHPFGDGPFTVLTMFDMLSGVSRKNPVAAITAFRRAFGDDPGCRLIVKAGHADDYPEGRRILAEAIDGARNIMLLDRSLTRTETGGLIAGCDVLLSLHRAEGFGLSMAEAMWRGRAIVATDWSGNTDFLNETNSRPVPYRLIPARDPQGTYDFPLQSWADADVDAAARALRQLREDAVLTRRLGVQARLDAQAVFSTGRYHRNIQHPPQRFPLSPPGAGRAAGG